MECIFTLKNDLGDQRCDPDALVARLGAAGCTDALVGLGQSGCLALECSREADSVRVLFAPLWLMSRKRFHQPSSLLTRFVNRLADA